MHIVWLLRKNERRKQPANKNNNKEKMKRKKKQQPNNVGEHIEVEKNDVKRELTGHRSCVLDNQDI